MPLDVINRTELQVERKGRRSPASSINILSDDILFEVFYCCQLDIPLGWERIWWYRLMHTCRRWRYIILDFSSSLRLLHLHCTYGKPVDEMLKYSPPLPLDINYEEARQMSSKDEEGVLLALQQHHRVRLIRLSEPGLQKLLAVMDKPFPMLEKIELTLKSREPCYHSLLPGTFTAPHLRHLYLSGQVGNVFAPGLPFVASITGLVTLTLDGIPPSSSLPVKHLVSCLSLMPLLKYLALQFDDLGPPDYYYCSFSTRRSDLAALQTVQLPKLEAIVFRGSCTYFEGLVSCIHAPFLTSFVVTFCPQRPWIPPLPRLSEFITAAKELRFSRSSLTFTSEVKDDPAVFITVAGPEQTIDHFPEDPPFRMCFLCRRLDEQVAGAAQICAALAPMLAEVERLNLRFYGSNCDRLLPPEIRREDWFDLLRPFCNVKKLQIDTAMAHALSLALCPEDGPPAEGILPELCKISRPHSARFLDPFIDARRVAGQPITKRRRLPTVPITHAESGEASWFVSVSDEEISAELASDSDFDSE